MIADGFPAVDRAVRGHRRLHPLSRSDLSAADAVVLARQGVRAAGTRSPPTTAWRRSRRSETPTWWPAAFPLRARTTPRRSPIWRSRWARRSSGCAAESGLPLEVRIGIDTGPVVAGVIGRAKFIYDLWGDTVNTASRMESHGVPGAIQVTERAYEQLRDRYDLRQRGTIEVKGKGPMTTYLLLGRRDESNAEPTAAAHPQPSAPNSGAEELYLALVSGCGRAIPQATYSARALSALTVALLLSMPRSGFVGSECRLECEKQPRTRSTCGRAIPGTDSHRRILGETISGRQVQAIESPALRGFHGPGRTRTCVLRIMSYVSGVEPCLLRGHSCLEMLSAVLSSRQFGRRFGRWFPCRPDSLRPPSRRASLPLSREGGVSSPRAPPLLFVQSGAIRVHRLGSSQASPSRGSGSALAARIGG